MPVPVVAIAAGIAGSVALEYIVQGGKMSQKETVTAIAIGSIPGVGLGLKGSIKLGQKLGTAATLVSKSKKLDDIKMIGQATVIPGSKVYLGRSLWLLSSGAAANVAIGKIYDSINSRGGSSSSNSNSSTTSQKRDGPPSLSRRTRRSPSFWQKKETMQTSKQGGKAVFEARWT